WCYEGGFRAGGNRTIGLGCYLTEGQFLEALRQLARTAFTALEAAKPGARVLVEKTPDHALHLPLIRRLYPDAAVIHVLRDGRDVVASLLAAYRQGWGRPWAPATAEAAAGKWVAWVREVRHRGEVFARFREVRYEDLLRAGPETLAALYDFLGLPLPPGQVQAVCRRFGFDACAVGAGGESLVLEGACKGAGAAE